MRLIHKVFLTITEKALQLVVQLCTLIDLYAYNLLTLRTANFDTVSLSPLAACQRARAWVQPLWAQWQIFGLMSLNQMSVERAERGRDCGLCCGGVQLLPRALSVRRTTEEGRIETHLIQHTRHALS